MEFEASGLNRQEFCQGHGLSTSTLDWLRKKRRQAGTEEGRRLVAVELCDRSQAASKDRDSRLAVALSSGRRIEIGRGFDASTLQQVVRLLEQI
jgi:hypothetical protein